MINEKRKEVIERIQEAVAHGDLSENADYAQAKEEQSFIEGRIQEIEDMIKNAEIIDTHGKHNTVMVGSTATVLVYDDKEQKVRENIPLLVLTKQTLLKARSRMNP